MNLKNSDVAMIASNDIRTSHEVPTPQYPLSPRKSTLKTKLLTHSFKVAGSPGKIQTKSLTKELRCLISPPWIVFSSHNPVRGQTPRCTGSLVLSWLSSQGLMIDSSPLRPPSHLKVMSTPSQPRTLLSMVSL